MSMNLIAALFLIAVVLIPVAMIAGLNTTTNRAEQQAAGAVWILITVAIVTGVWMALYIFGVRVVIS